MDASVHTAATALGAPVERREGREKVTGTARYAAAAVRVDYAVEDHDVTLTATHPDAYTPEQANGGYPGSREHGDPEGVFASAEVRVDVDYRVPPLHNHPMEPHATTAEWHD